MSRFIGICREGTYCSLPQHKWTIWWMLFKNRQYVIEKIKAPLMKAIVNLSTFNKKKEILKGAAEIIRLCNLYPEPTKEHTLLSNTHIWIDVENKFFEYESNKGREALFRALWRMFIIEYEHDPYYRYRIDWVIEEIVKVVISGKWKTRTMRQDRFWKEPERIKEE